MTPRTTTVVLAALLSVGVLGWAASRPGRTAAPPSSTARPPTDAAAPRSPAVGDDAAAMDFLNVRLPEPPALLEEHREADLLRRELEEMGLVDEDAPGE